MNMKTSSSHRTHICGQKHAQIAPIFFKQSGSKRRSDGDLESQKGGRPPHRGDLPKVTSQRWLTTSAVSPLKQEEGFSQSARRKQLSPSSLYSCLEDITASNPEFPVQTVFSTLQRKARETLQDGSTENALQNVTGKRKRGEEISDRVSKRLRWCLTAKGAADVDRCHPSRQGNQDSVGLPVKEQPGSSKLSRSHRLRQQRRSFQGLMNICELKPEQINDTESAGQPPRTSDSFLRDSRFEDHLWTERYSPQCSSEVIGNSASVNTLHSWLKKWKLRAISEERMKTEERKDGDNSSDSWDCGDFQGEAGAEDNPKDPLCNTMLITGPPGVGKTASVYACAQELGFKVFEVNCSSQRNGRHVLSQLKEATQSHLVETSEKDPLKPAYLNNYNRSSRTAIPEALPGRKGKTEPHKNIISTTKKKMAQKFGRSNRKGKANPGTVTLAAFFKMKAKADHLQFGGLVPCEKPDSKKLSSSSPGCGQTVAQSKKTATSLILFEEVDVIFSDDVGFLTAIKTFMTTTKRPVILTTNDPLFGQRFNGNFEEVIFKPPSVVNICSYLQLVCLVENVRLELEDVRALLTLTCGDVRRCLLQLQLWVHSGDGQASLSAGSSKEPTHIQNFKDPDGRDNLHSSLPPCDTGCTASMLGLHLSTQDQLLNLLKCHHRSTTDMDKVLSLLAQSRRRGIPLLYTNLELLLPFGTEQTSVQHQYTSATSKSVQTISRLSRRNQIATSKFGGTTLSSMLTHKPPRTSLSLRWHSKRPCPSDKSEQTSKGAADCLNALSDFFDLLSCLDVTLPAEAQLDSGSWRPEAFAWTGAEIKDGLLDEISDEGGWNWSQKRLLDIQAAAEGFGFHRCWGQMSTAWAETQKYTQELEDTQQEGQVDRLIFSATPKRQSLRFSIQPLCAQSVSQSRSELSRAVLRSEPLSLLGNSRAISVDYMPVLRYICRFHRAQSQKEKSGRCLKYLSRKHLGLSKSTFHLLAEDFP
ncbi:ATPase family AAA domain-containing protein 5b isoform X2 [Echeneis naucrates]|uniref:ATPase family AAA domain-containing protein 5b isoform X2 n=1 Tax=Echeneis naucrates TaxID=173247 RepID=UPI00111384BF|nr:ATPase family AAA domain-containing protein 5-like isoform X2 [Echeneis naucrates]